LTDAESCSAISPPGLILMPTRRAPPPAPDAGPAAASAPPQDDEPAGTLEEEQAVWVKRRREITELELAKRRGDLISSADARQGVANLGRRIRLALDRAPQLLPAHLPPDVRATCETALRQAIAGALAAM